MNDHLQVFMLFAIPYHWGPKYYLNYIQSVPVKRSALQQDIAYGTAMAEAEDKQETIREFKPLSRLIEGTRNNLAKVAKNVPCIIFDLSWIFSAWKSVHPLFHNVNRSHIASCYQTRKTWISLWNRLVGKTSVMKSLPVSKWCGIFII